MDPEYGLGVSTELDFDQAVMRTRVALQAKGFGILSEMTPPPQPGSGRHHLFMSVWQQLISTENLGLPGADVGDHMTCNVVVYEELGKTQVAVLDPTEGLEGWLDIGIPSKARKAIEEVLEEVAGPSGLP
ncbi:MAG: hypothetical protein ACRD1T_03630 [Acidimicrobiia bacterium]